MASLVLGAAGAAVGGALVPGSFSLFGATIGGASVGGALGALAGAGIDDRLFGPTYEGPRIEALSLQSSTEGAGIARVFGRARVAGQVIWAARFKEYQRTETHGGKGGGVRTREYSYSLSFAVALCEGEIAALGRAWADGAAFDLSGANWRLFRGTQDQAPDAAIEAVEGAGNAPAFRGTAYIVFEDLDLSPFGGRVPNLSFEILRRPESHGGPRLETLVKGVALIPGSGEFVYATEPVDRVIGPGRSASESIHNSRGVPDIEAALDDLAAQLPACESVNLIVAWFGTDLRAGECEIRPGVEYADKEIRGAQWRVNGVGRGGAYVVSRTPAGAPVYGGTPSDGVVLQAIAELKARGYRVMLTPFILMDIAPDNTLPDPYGEAAQAAYPWRGRIGVHPAAGQDGSPDQTAAAADQIDAVFGAAQAGDFGAGEETTTYSGPAEWSLRRMALHYAKLAQMAGGVDGFLIGTELRGITTARSAPGTYPAVAHLQDLAAEVRSLLPDAEISYGADWSEYFGHHPDDGSGDAYFHLDPLWADPEIDFVGIDWYGPLSDWREGAGHLDADLAWGPHALDYLQSNVEGGEGYDWYYASFEDRRDQIRTPIEGWIYRYKDLRAWWGNGHVDRPGGGVGSATPWVARSKPIRFTEIGCPAVDKGANQPNVFYDPKSSESELPYFSSGKRDDFIQRRYLEAALGYWAAAAGNNPQSEIYNGPMLDMDNAHVWTWDARPYPDFPARTDIWADGPNWTLGHWLTGRVGLALLPDVVAEVATAAGLPDADVSGLDGVVAGYVLGAPGSARDALAPLAAAYRFDMVEGAGGLRFVHRGREALAAPIAPDNAVWREGQPRYALARGQAEDLPREARVRFIEEARDYQPASVSAFDRDAEHERAIALELPLLLDPERAQALARTAVAEARAGIETLELELPPSRLDIEPGDAAAVMLGGVTRRLRAMTLGGGAARRATLARLPDAPPAVAGPAPGTAAPPRPGLTRPALWVLDLPLLPGETERDGPVAAAFADPWPGELAIWAGSDLASMTPRARVGRAAILGTLVWDLYSGPVGRWDDGNRVRVRLYSGALSSLDRLSALAGGNLLAVENPEGGWEILSARNAELVAPGEYVLSGLLRGLSGTEGAMAHPVPAGARLVVLDSALVTVPLEEYERRAPLVFGAGAPALEPGAGAFETVETSWDEATLRPLSPVHLRGSRAPNGVRITWQRRTRIGGEGWGIAETPLGEAAEAYVVEVLSGGEVALTLEASAPEALLPLADETAIFGGMVWSFDVRVYQLSAAYGRGSPAERTLYLTP